MLRNPWDGIFDSITEVREFYSFSHLGFSTDHKVWWGVADSTLYGAIAPVYRFVEVDRYWWERNTKQRWAPFPWTAEGDRLQVGAQTGRFSTRVPH